MILKRYSIQPIDLIKYKKMNIIDRITFIDMCVCLVLVIVFSLFYINMIFIILKRDLGAQVFYMKQHFIYVNIWDVKIYILLDGI